MSRISIIIFSLFFHLVIWGVDCVDRTLEGKASGSYVVDAVVDKIQGSRIFPDDKLFLRRIAYVESKDGTDTNTYRSGYYGGIWQVDRVGFESTQDTTSHPGLTSKFQSIQTIFGIDWTAVQWSDLEKPLYSGLAARLFLSNINQAIPRDVSGQATYWKTHYNRAGAGTEQKFIDDVAVLEEQTKCEILRADVVFVLDSSGSVGSRNFQDMLTFVTNVVRSFPVGLNEVRIGLIQYSNAAITEFTLDYYSSLNSIISAISGVSYLGGGTATHLGLLSLLNVMENSGRRNITGTPQIGIVITDGRSNNNLFTAEYARRVHDKGIIVFAIGVTTGIDYSELQQIASETKYVANLDGFTDFNSFRSEIEARTCKVSPNVEAEAEITGTLSKNQAVYFTTKASIRSGATIKIAMKTGSTSVYASYSTSNPSPALYDHKFDGDTSKPFQHLYVPPPNENHQRRRRDVSNSTTNSTVPLYTAIFGTSNDNNSFVLTMYIGQEQFGGGGTAIVAEYVKILIALLFCVALVS